MKLLEQTDAIICSTHNYSLELLVHGLQVANLSCAIGQNMGFSSTELEVLHKLSLLHDIGKSLIPEQVLYKPSKLNKSEWEIMKKHSVYSQELYNEYFKNEDEAFIVGCHHENYDGSGYPYNLKAEEIPLMSRIIAMADMFEAMTSPRVYRPFIYADPLEIMKGNVGIKLDGNIFEMYSKKVFQDWIKRFRVSHKMENIYL